MHPSKSCVKKKLEAVNSGTHLETCVSQVRPEVHLSIFLWFGRDIR